MPAKQTKKIFVIKSKQRRDLQNGIILIPTAETDDAIKAHQCLEYGCEVTDKATGKPAFEDEPEPGIEVNPVAPLADAANADIGASAQ